jgi:elongation factor P
VAIVLPQKVVLEIADTEPATKGQTASSSYKPATLSNGVRTNIRRSSTRHARGGDDRRRSYVERAKD